MKQRPSLVAQLSSTIVEAPSPYVSAPFQWPSPSSGERRPRSRSESRTCRISSEGSFEIEPRDTGSPGQVRVSRLRSGSVPAKPDVRASSITGRKSECRTPKLQDGVSSGRSSIAKDDRGGKNIIYPDERLEEKPLTFFSSAPATPAGLRKKSVLIKAPPSIQDQPKEPPPVIDENQELVDRLFATTAKVEEKTKADEAKPSERVSVTSTLKEDRRSQQGMVPKHDNKTPTKSAPSDGPTLTEVDKAWFEAVAGRLSDAEDDSREESDDDVEKEEERLRRLGEADDEAFRKRLISSNDVKEQWARKQRQQELTAKAVEEPVVIILQSPPSQPEIVAEVLTASPPVLEQIMKDDCVVAEPVVGEVGKPELPAKDPSARPKSRMASASKKGSKKKSLTVSSFSGRPTSSRLSRSTR
ncbi:hypothetical protein HDU67_000227 [Dinochytrium kinnereticum]|nr:hypothetical protein HDU67_000227 [Dinochytrium kinnereticum]